MKKKIFFPGVLILALVLGACGNIGSTSQSELILTVVHFSVIGTLTAMVPPPTGSPTATSTPSPTREAYTATLTPTPLPSSTQVIQPPNTQDTWYWPTTTANGCYDAAFVKDVNIADGTVLAPGEEFEKTWKFKNTGSCTWTSKFLMVFISGNDMQGSDTRISQTVEFAKKADITVSLVAPKREGRYRGYWQLADKNGYTFGARVYVSIVVSDSAETLTPTKTPVTPPPGTCTITATPNLTPSPTHHKPPTHEKPPDKHIDSTSPAPVFTPLPPVTDSSGS